MILQGKAARPLGRLALLIVLGIGGLLLAIAPGTADPPTASPAQPSPESSGNPADRPQLAFGQPIEQKNLLPTIEQPKLSNDVAELLRLQSSAPGFPGSPDQIQTAREEVELLEAQLDVKRAQITAAELAAAAAEKMLQRGEQLFKSHAIGDEDIDKLRFESASRKAEVQIRRAEMHEPEIRLRQARRRLKAVMGDAAQASPVSSRTSRKSLKSSAKKSKRCAKSGDHAARCCCLRERRTLFGIRRIRP
jgi:hypothetical protein